MRKQLFFLGAVAFLMLCPAGLFAQSTEGTDFWVTFLRANENGPDGHNLSLVFAAKDTANVHIENSKTGYTKDVVVPAGKTYSLEYLNKSDCYVGDNEEEIVSNNALHISSDKTISVIASNYGRKTFDVAAIMPTKALKSEYYIQSYSPSSHGSDDPSQGSHFAIVAAEDDVVVDFTTTVLTKKMREGAIPQRVGDIVTTPVLKQGQVYYVWTGEGEQNEYDLTGSWVKARNNKKIAVFNGNPHTNIPYKINSRDHVYSQAMPVEYWGKRFAITSSLTTIKDTPTGSVWERLDKIRVMALSDSTAVIVNGDTIHVFSFEKGDADDKKHFFEFEFGVKDSKSSWQTDPLRPNIKRIESTNCFIETSCPCAVHLFLTSNRYDHAKVKDVNEKYCNGDPSLIWINPIEQRIDTLTFGTFETNQVKDHFLNIVTLNDSNNLKSIKFDEAAIGLEFQPMTGNADYVFARKKIEHGTHSLTADSGFIAHVYGFGDEESYGYPAGGNTKDLTAFITINGTVYKPGEDNLICGKNNKVVFGCELNYEYDSIYWSFGDGLDSISLPGVDSIEHFYAHADVYKPYVLIYRHMGEDDGCVNFDAKDSISFIANIGNFKVDIKGQKMPECAQRGQEVDFLIYLDNPSQVDLTTDSVQLTFNQTALDDGFSNDQISVSGDTMLTVQLPSTARENVEYGLHLHIGSECPNSVLDKDLSFHFAYARALLQQRYSNVLGLVKDSFDNKSLSDFVWYHDGEIIPNQQTSVLYLDETNPDHSGEYKVCYTIHEEGKPDYNDCTCPVTFQPNTLTPNFSSDSILDITATYLVEGKKVFVNANWGGKTDIECYAQWIDVSGNVWGAQKYNIPDGGCTIPVPTEKGFYILRVVTDGAKRSFKFIIH